MVKENTHFHDRYILERLLGRGGFSEVWLAKDTKTDILVALKIYAPTTGLDDQGLKVLSREFAIVVNANHKNLLKPLYFDTFDRKPYLVLPYCKRGSIQKSIGQFTEPQAWQLLHDVASGLAFLHSMDPIVIHQDIKPDNIMVADNGVFMITDFGISAHARSALRKSTSVSFASAGTITYMAPERFSKDNSPIMANDIYSLGATCYEMITGEPPFGNDGGLLQKRGADIPELPGNYSEGLRAIINQCLMENPWDRPTAQTLEKIAQQAIEGERSTTAGADVEGDLQSSGKSRNIFAIAGSLAAAVLFLCIIVILFLQNKEEPIGGDLQSPTDIAVPDSFVTACTKIKTPATAQQGLDMLTRLADDNDADAIYLLSRLCFESKKADDICPDSVRLMQKASNINIDNRRAHELLQKAVVLAPQNYFALYELGCDYMGGHARTDAVERDTDAALRYFKDAMRYATAANDTYYMKLIQQKIDVFKEYEE